MAKGNKSKHVDIVLANLHLVYQCEKLDVLEPISQSEIDRLTKTCWACGAERKSVMIRAHVVAKSVGGSDTPDNYFLLCDVCHAEQPDGLSREIQESWLIESENWFVRLFKVWTQYMEELKKKHGGNVEEYISERHFSIKKLAKEGYGSAAGWQNGRHNFLALVKRDYISWVLDCNKKQRKLHYEQ